jgi:hypothetical protein
VEFNEEAAIEAGFVRAIGPQFRRDDGSFTNW